jgi:hypothetical protein
VIGHDAIEIEPAEPAVGKVEMDLLAQPPLRPDAHAITDQQHPDHQFGIDRGATRRTIERLQVLANAVEIDEPVNRAQQVIARHMILDAEAVKQRLLHHRVLAHHHNVSACCASTESGLYAHRKQEFFNRIRPISVISLPRLVARHRARESCWLEISETGRHGEQVGRNAGT